MTETDLIDDALVGHPEPKVRAEAAKRLADEPDIAPAMLAFLRSDPRPAVRLAFEQSRRGADDRRVVLRMMRSEDELERKFAARQLSSVGLLYRLARDPSWRVREAVAENSATPVEVLLILASDPSEEVRLAVASDDRCAREVMQLLRKDPNAAIRDEIRSQKKWIKSRTFVDSSDAPRAVGIWVHKLLNRDSASIKKALGSLGSFPNYGARVSLARQSWMPPSVLTEWARGGGHDTRRAVAENPSTPLRALSELARDRDEAVSEAAVASAVTRMDARGSRRFDFVVNFHADPSTHRKKAHGGGRPRGRGGIRGLEPARATADTPA